MFEHIITLHTHRLVLRQISIADMVYLYPISFYDGLPIRTEEGIRDKLYRINEDIQSGNTLHWGIALPEKNIIIGTVGFYRGFNNKTGEIGYVLNQSYWRKGYMFEAVTKILEFGFSQLQLEKVIAYTAESNAASVQLLVKAGFRETSSDDKAYLKFVIYASGPATE